jgi:hypothetical protein
LAQLSLFCLFIYFDTAEGTRKSESLSYLVRSSTATYNGILLLRHLPVPCGAYLPNHVMSHIILYIYDVCIICRLHLIFGHHSFFEIVPAKKTTIITAMIALGGDLLSGIL